MSAPSTDTAKQSAYFRLIKLPTMKSSADVSAPRTAWDHFADPEHGLAGYSKLPLRVLVFVAPYEGGHPDHDTAALMAHLGAKKLVRGGHKSPVIVEMTSYHLRDSRCVTGEFLATNGASPPELAVELSLEEQEIKKKMIECYRS